MGLLALPMLKRSYHKVMSSGRCPKQKRGIWSERLITGSLLATIYLQAAATFQERTLTTCGDFTNDTLVLLAGLFTLVGFGLSSFDEKKQPHEFYSVLGTVQRSI